MKRFKIYSLLGIITAVLTFAACTPEEEDVRLDPDLATLQVTNVTSSSATISGFVIAEGEGLTEKGVVYDVTSDPTTEANKVAAPDSVQGDAEYSITLESLDFATKYYVKAYAMTIDGAIYGDTISFTTKPVVATVTTTAASDVTGTTAVSGGEVTAEGGAEVTARGIVYSMDAVPHLDSANSMVLEEGGTGTGTFTVNMEGLSGQTTYYFRAYATNSAGTAYGDILDFTTEIAELTWYIPGDYVEAGYPGSGLANWAPDNTPYIKSGADAPNNLEGYIYMANANNEWKVATQPNWDDTNYAGTITAENDVKGSGTLTVEGANLALPAGYYKLNVNASDLTFTYYDAQWGVIGTATADDWNSDQNLIYVPEAQRWRGGIAMTEGEFKFRASDDWEVNYGGSFDDPTLVFGSPDNFQMPAGSPAADYAIELDFSTPLNYTYSIHRWGIIGSATPGGWDNDTDMTWDAENEVFTIDVTMVEGEFKFRADDDWAVNWGGDIGAMTQDGGNIPVSAGTYTITLNPWEGTGSITPVSK